VNLFGGGWPTSGRKYNPLSWIVSKENKEGVPLLGIFEKWGAVLPAAGWVNGKRVAGDFRVVRQHISRSGEMGLMRSAKAHFSKIVRRSEHPING
jgi:hypothetical protein